ncbi:leucine-rich receptor-like protein kinase family protein [Striga asiatica]|uniref:Leucine-rich receptor-like protein kinase family protein n=1 Tax=Striga asiatica TaxID=4170 RepID=A0A5A7RGD6_STRAF|nr:leucine-rich receptor-like protein kinase family protein [Striga asiatica]
MLKFRVGYDWVPHFQLKSLSIVSVEIGGPFPEWLQTQKALAELDLSNCSIKGTLPQWLHSMNLTHLILFQNQIDGPIPELASSLKYLDLSYNMVNGSIPDSLCQMKSLVVVEISMNQLSGNLPNCWSSLNSLYVAKMSSNRLSGPIPDSIGGAYARKYVIWEFATQWIGSHLLALAVLRLRSDRFYGAIPSGYCDLYELKVMDLSHNDLTGNNPSCLGKLLGMIKGDTISAGYSNWSRERLAFVLKGRMLEFMKLSTYLVLLDLSSNYLVGEIPSDLTKLAGLLALTKFV